MKKFLQILKNEQAVTLVELMLALAILLCIVVLWVVMTKNTASYENFNSQFNMQEAAKNALNLMSKEIRGARDFSQVVMAGLPPFRAIAFRTMDNRVIGYRLQPIDATRTDLVKDIFAAPNLPPIIAPTITMTLLQNIQTIDFGVTVDGTGHPTDKQVSIEIEMRAPFVKDGNFKKHFESQVFVRNPL